ncbi:MerR family transcriptional regulator [Kitasatospora sp. NPDC048540]|uniref:MerR family transcriptional regulator n=1 Tax=unclassified Kitasatospora TaxID=2633591 RepID=UPI00053AF0F2|nr:MerR family transcriptional regulator [Kitasatospora sp. MBT63]
MRIGELSKRAGVPVPTIKYYVREGLIPGGERIGPNQARYGEEHIHRLKLVRAMVDVGKLSVAATREVLSAIDSPGSSLHDVLGIAQAAVTPQVTAGDRAVWAAAEHEVAELVRRRGWVVKESNPARQALAQLVVTFRDLGQQDLLAILDDYASVAERLAAAELAAIGHREGVDSKVEGAVLGTVLGDALIGAMRRLAQADASHRAFHTAVPG